MNIKIVTLFLKKSSFYISLLSLFKNKESKKASKYSLFQALYKISCYFIILIIVLKFSKRFLGMSARATRLVLAPLKAAGLASSRTPLSLSGANALLQSILFQNRLQVLLAVFGTKTRLLCKLAKSLLLKII